VPDNVSAYQVLEKFKESKIHCCYIVDEYGSLLGMITLNDILEAIVGDIPEQHTDDYEIIDRRTGHFLLTLKFLSIIFFRVLIRPTG
jgi:putative hemolysin